MTDDGAVLDDYAILLPGGAVVLASPLSVLDVQRSLREAVKAAARSGYAVPRRVAGLIELLERAHVEQSRVTSALSEVPHGADTSGSGNDRSPNAGDVSTWHASAEIDSTEAAAMLEVTDRQVRNRAAELGGRRVGRAWRFDRAVIAHEAERHTREGRNGMNGSTAKTARREPAAARVSREVAR